jgi:hypothetical protein
VGIKLGFKMTKVMRGDGNGCIIVSKWIAAFIGFLTLASIVWGMATSYSMKTEVVPIAKKVTSLETRLERLERLEATIARIEGNVQILVNRDKNDK